MIPISYILNKEIIEIRVEFEACWPGNRYVSPKSLSFPWLSLAIHLYLPTFPADLQDYTQCSYRAVVDKFLLVSQHLHVSVKGSIRECCLWVYPYFSNSVLYVLFVLFGWFYRCPYSCCFVGCWFQDLFNIAHSIFRQFPSSFFFIHLISVHVVHPYSRIDTTTEIPFYFIG